MEIVSSFIQPLMSCIGTPVIRQFGYFKVKQNVDELIKCAADLEAKKKDTQDHIDAASREGKQCTNEVRQWIQKVEGLGGEVTKVQNDYRDYEQSGRCDFLGRRLPNCCSRYKIGRRASKLLIKLNALKNELAGFDVLATDAPPASVQQMSSTSNVVGDTFTSNKEKICGYLKSEEETDGVFGIWGMGGVGKTTLLEAINDNFLSNNGSSATKKLFDHVIFLVVSKEYQIENLQKIIIEKLGLKLREGSVSQAGIITEYLKEKNFLLLMDDIWEVVQLKNLGIPYPCQVGSSSNNGGRFQRKVVFTTRSLQVCKSMDCDERNIIKMECLEADEAWNLFKKKVGERIINLPGIKSRAEEVAMECGGLPIALVVIGRAMSANESPQEWDYALQQLKNSQPNNIPGMEMEEKNYFPRLKFSYDGLRDDKMRECFLCCSLWPEDFEIEKEELIMCWMGLGLIDDFEDINEAYNKGYSLIGSLTIASLFEPVHEKDVVIKVHDVIRDLALWIACGSGTNSNRWLVKAGVGLKEVPRGMVVKWKVAERVSLMRNAIKELPYDLPPCPNLSTLLLQENDLNGIPGGFFTRMSNLTYLDLRSSTLREVPGKVSCLKEICCLVQLRYLNLSDVFIESLPKELEQLTNLKYLLLHGTYVGEVIRGIIEKLLKLEYLDLYPHGCVDTDELLRLRMLKALGMMITSEHALRQLSRTPILYLKIKDMGDSSSTSIHLHHLLSSCTQLSLRELKFRGCRSIRELVVDADVRFPRLESLWISALENLTKIVWRSVLTPSECFQRLRELKIFLCKGLKDITWVLHLASLEELCLCGCDEMEQLAVIGGGEKREKVTGSTFPRLRELKLCDLPKLAMICDNHAAVNFPSLEVLIVEKCNGLKDIRALHLPCLEELYLSEMEQLVVIGGGEVTEPTFPRLRKLRLEQLPKFAMICDNHAAVNFPSLEYLRVEKCNGLKDITWVLHLPCLEFLALDDCCEMEKLVVIGGGEVTVPTFPRLRELRLEQLPKLAMICDNNHAAAAAAVNFPSLEILHVLGCNGLKELPFHPQLLNNNNNCSRLKTIWGTREWWEGIQWEDQSSQSSLLQPYFKAWGLNSTNPLKIIEGDREWWEGIEWEDQSAKSSLQPFFQNWC